MEQGLKERLTGAAVLVILAVIFIPMLLDDTEEGDIVITETNIPPKPETMPGPPDAVVPSPETDFTSKVVPLEREAQPAVTPEPEAVTPAPEVTATATTTEQNETSAGQTESASPPLEAVPKPELQTTPEAAPDTPSQSTAAVMQSDEVTNHVGLSAWVVQLGSFASAENAESLNQRLRKAGFRSFVEPLEQGGKTSYRVRVGPELKRSDAQAINDKLKSSLQLQGIVVQYP